MRLYDSSSPCTWGCFHAGRPGCYPPKVFPMHVGVFLKVTKEYFETEGLPHARGGVSSTDASFSLCLMSSPCTWGCFSEGSDAS